MRFLKRLVIVVGVFMIALGTLGALYQSPEPKLRLSRTLVDLDGTKLAYHQAGQGRDLVFIHGSMGSAEDFEPLIPALARDHRLTVFDRPGFGASPLASGDYTITANARRIAEAIRKLGLVRPIVVGHSHGGAVSLRLATDFPELVGGLVLIAPSSFKSPNPIAMRDRLLAIPYVGEGLAVVLGRILGPRIITRVVEDLLGPDRTRMPSDFLSWRIETWVRPQVLTTRSRQNVSNPEELDALLPSYSKLRVRTTVFWCAQDPSEKTSTIDSHRLSDLLPNSHEIPLDDCGHYIQFRYPERIVEELKTL